MSFFYQKKDAEHLLHLCTGNLAYNLEMIEDGGEGVKQS